MEGTSHVGRSQLAAGQPVEERPGLWARLKEKVDPALYRPAALPGTVISRLAGREGEYYVLKNAVTKTYYRLSDRDHFLWVRMDGSATVKDLVVAYFLEYGSFAFARIAALVQGLKAGFFLTEQPVDVYQQVRKRLEARRPGYRLAQVFQAFLQKQTAISGLDQFLASVYRWGGRLLFTWPCQILFLGVSVAGLYAFARVLDAAQYGVVTIAGSLVLGIIGLIVANLLAVFLHEMAHALTVKHYGCDVRRGGFMIYFGMPAFFVDTTDIWLVGKRGRLAVTWAGPYSGLILGGLSSIILLFWPGFSLNPLFFQFAFLTYLSVFLNLNPLLELDGYYLLMDWLEIPMLRRKSLEFIRTGLRQKLRSLEVSGECVRKRTALGTASGLLASFSREEKIFVVFGLLSAVWTAYAIYMGLYFWQQRLVGALRNLWRQGDDLVRIALALGAAAVSLLFVLSIGLALYGLARGMLAWVARRGFFSNTWNVAAMLLVVAAALTLAPAALRESTLARFLSLLAPAGSTVLAWRAALDRAGSRLSRVFWLLGLFALMLLWQQVTILIADLDLLRPILLTPVVNGLGHLGLVALLLAGLFLFADTDLRELLPVEKILLGLGLVASYVLVTAVVSMQQAVKLPAAEMLLAVSSFLVPLLVLALLVPTLFSFWRTAFGPAWMMLALALGGLLAVTLFGLSPLLPYLLLAASLYLHHLAYTRVTFLTDPPEAVLDLSDRSRLQRAFAWTTTAIHIQFRQTAGDRSGRVLVERFNNYAVAAGWLVSVTRDQVEDYLPADMSLIERGSVYAAALTLLLDLVAQEMGEKPTVRALQRAYDLLPWEEREIGAQYLFRDVKRAEALSRTFQVTQQDYRGLLRRMPLFATMSNGELDLLLSRLKPERYAPGKAIIRQGDRGDRFYVIRRGHVDVTQRDERGVTDIVNQLDRGDYFGELALLRDAPRNATCRATVPSEILSLSRQDFDTLVKGRFALREKVDRTLTRAELLRQLPLFAELDGLQIQHISAQLREEELEAGVIFIRQGELGETFHVIESGRVQVFVAQNGEERVIVERGPGEYVGEIALLLDVPRTASVRTLEPTRLLALRKDDFDRLVSEHLFIGRGLEQETSRRIIDLRRAVSQA